MLWENICGRGCCELSCTAWTHGLGLQVEGVLGGGGGDRRAGGARAEAEAKRQAAKPQLTEAEKKAAALPPKLTVPMILFFLPVLFIVIIAPAMIKVFGPGGVAAG